MGSCLISIGATLEGAVPPFDFDAGFCRCAVGSGGGGVTWEAEKAVVVVGFFAPGVGKFWVVWTGQLRGCFRALWGCPKVVAGILGWGRLCYRARSLERFISIGLVVDGTLVGFGFRTGLNQGVGNSGVGDRRGG